MFSADLKVLSKLDVFDLDSIVLRSASLVERLNNAHSYDTSAANELRLQRLSRWRQVLEADDPKVFQKRLNWSAISIELTQLPFGDPVLRPGHALPSWALLLETILQHIDAIYSSDGFDQEQTEIDGSINCIRFEILVPANEEIPYQDLLTPWVGSLTSELLAQLSPQEYALVEGNQALGGLQLALLRHLTSSCQRVFSKKQKLLSLIAGCVGEQEVGSSEYPHLRLWIQEEAGWRKLCMEYPVLARLIASTGEAWINDSKMFIQRLYKDKDQISDELLLGKHFSRIVRIEDALSDPHGQKQYVKRVWLDEHTGFVYKPRDVRLMSALGSLVEQIKDVSNQFDLEVLKVVAKKDYGWIELAKSQSCIDEAGGTTYYRRAGMLLAILYLLRTNDCHRENLIASADNPFLIDGDTIMTPGFLDLTKSTASEAHAYHREIALQDTVLSTGMLPQWDELLPEPHDVSALGGILRDISLIQKAPFSEIDQSIATIVQDNTPFFQETIFKPDDYALDLCEGYRIACQALRALSFSAFNDWLDTLSGFKTRILHRPTRVYEQFRQKLLQPQFLVDGIERSIKLESLFAKYLKLEQKPLSWSIIEAEVEQLENDNIPIFMLAVEDEFLSLPGSELGVPFVSALSIARERFLNVTQNPTLTQEAYIRASCCFWSLQLREANEMASPSSLLSQNPIQVAVRNDGFLKNAAESIASSIEARAQGTSVSGLSWIGVNVLESLKRLQLAPIGSDLYAGNAGVGLFYAALAKIQGLESHSSHSRDMAFACYKPILELSRDAIVTREVIDQLGVGGMTGFGSLIYALSLSGWLVSDESWIDAAVLFSQQVTLECIAADESLDVMSGSAGLLLALLALNDLRPSEALEQKCIQCGLHLVAQQTEIGFGQFAWKTLNGKALTGMSHGAAGIAMALLRLYKKTRNVMYKDAALAGITYENTQFSNRLNNWLDLRFPHDSAMVSWCHGAAGIGMARLDGYSLVDNEVFISDIQRALEIICREQSLGLHQICCGSMGRAEFLLAAGLIQSEPDLIEAAKNLAGRTVESAGQSFAYELLGGVPSWLPLSGLFQGQAGIGYQLLRLSAPDQIPSVLVLQSPCEMSR